MTAEFAYLDTSVLAKWYLNEPGSDAAATFIQSLDVAIISDLTTVEMRSLLSRRRRMGEIDPSLESMLFAALEDDIANGHLQLYPLERPCWLQAANLISLYRDHAIRTLDALHLAIIQYHGIESVATADRVMANLLLAMGVEVIGGP